MASSVDNFNPEDYEYKNDMLGKGAFGEVLKATAKKKRVKYIRRKDLPEELAVKIMKWIDEDSKYKNTESLLIERGLKFDHKNLVRIFHISLDKMNANWTRQMIYMELCDEDLKDYQKGKEILKIPEIRHVLKGILNGLAYIHGNGVIHRDLKEENVLLKRINHEGDTILNYDIKLGDFNISKPQENMFCMTNTKNVGTESYRAPEVSQTHYGSPCDLWSLGILAFRLQTREEFPIIVGKPGDKDVICSELEKIEEEDLKNFLQQCLRLNPAERFTAVQLLDHPFLLQELSPEYKRVAGRIDNDSVIDKPSVSYLTQLCVLARCNMIGPYHSLVLNTDYSGVRWLGELVSKARMLAMWPGTVLSRTQWEELGRVASSNWGVRDLWIECNIPDYVLGNLVTNAESVYICYYAPHLVNTIAQGINTGHIVRCSKIVLYSMLNKESVGRELQTRLGWRLSRNGSNIILEK